VTAVFRYSWPSAGSRFRTPFSGFDGLNDLFRFVALLDIGHKLPHCSGLFVVLVAQYITFSNLGLVKALTPRQGSQVCEGRIKRSGAKTPRLEPVKKFLYLAVIQGQVSLSHRDIESGFGLTLNLDLGGYPAFGLGLLFSLEVLLKDASI